MAGIREGYLLHLDAQNDNLGDIHYAALEEGMLKMYSSPDRQDAHLILSVSLARHSIEVDMVPFSDGNGLPCRFFVHLTPADGSCYDAMVESVTELATAQLRLIISITPSQRKRPSCYCSPTNV
ncbi:hypothetical protein H310_12203 [Aphanomyces invadans]|uniref:Uncharacterized protein n=1 Tax=Aphanomyces invadans TaxID=157072 RepID=A0A024TJS1_9STRA|nr:hypothetical protein H310_12203 [Aphanomyces invadans]ETV93851.1 hypothetical protein H310_12203 [Aphanomyces invadans]|eukprot:XP_008877411.1 hypothetical protein H310_12203 [Aphanomyces invadans]